MVESVAGADHRRTKCIITTLNEELALAEKNPNDYCPGYVTSKNHVKQALQRGVRSMKLINEYKECYECDGKDLNCIVYQHFLRSQFPS